MPKEEKHVRRSSSTHSKKLEGIVEHNIEAGKGRRHVQWGPNEKRSQSKSHELDELAQDVRCTLSQIDVHLKKCLARCILFVKTLSY
jgi:hypothetical protein